MQLNAAGRRALFAGSSTGLGAECRPLRAHLRGVPMSGGLVLFWTEAARRTKAAPSTLHGHAPPTGIIGQVATHSLVVAPDGRPGSVPLTLRPLVNEDTPALQEMLDDPGIREVMGWRDDEYRDAGQVIDGLQDEQIDFYRYRYTFGIVPDHVDALAGVAIVTIGQAEPA